MRFFDLVKEYDGERLLANRVCEFAPYVVSDIARRRADQALIRVLCRKLGHVEADVGAFVAEEQAC